MQRQTRGFIVCFADFKKTLQKHLNLTFKSGIVLNRKQNIIILEDNMKKIICAILLVATLLSFCSCGQAQKKVKVIDIALTVEDYAFAVKKGNAELLGQLNDFLAEIQKNGEFKKVLDKYFAGGTPEAVTSATKDESKKQIVVATNAAFKPFEYTEGGKFYGVDMEIMSMFAKSIDAELVIDDMQFESVCTAVGNGNCDIAASGLTIKPDREEILDFSTSYYNSAQKIICLEDDTTFAECKTVEDMEAALKALPEGTKFGAQAGTTGYLYITGDEDWGFEGYKNISIAAYDNGSMAVQDLINGNIKYVIIDDAPASNIVKSFNG